MGLFSKKGKLDKLIDDALSGPPSRVFPDKGKVRPAVGKPPKGFREIKCPYCKHGFDKVQLNKLCAICDGAEMLWVGK